MGWWDAYGRNVYMVNSKEMCWWLEMYLYRNRRKTHYSCVSNQKPAVEIHAPRPSSGFVSVEVSLPCVAHVRRKQAWWSNQVVLQILCVVLLQGHRHIPFPKLFFASNQRDVALQLYIRVRPQQNHKSTHGSLCVLRHAIYLVQLC